MTIGIGSKCQWLEECSADSCGAFAFGSLSGPWFVVLLLRRLSVNTVEIVFILRFAPYNLELTLGIY